MLKVGDGKAGELSARITLSFDDADAALAQQLRFTMTAAGARGSLVSGHTMKECANIVGELSSTATSEALDAFDRACSHPWVSRRDLQAVVRQDVLTGFKRLENRTLASVRTWGFEPKHIEKAEPLFAAAQARALRQVTDHFTGWSGPALKWVQRHPGLTLAGSLLLTLIVAIAGDLISAGILATWQRPPSTP